MIHTLHHRLLLSVSLTFATLPRCTTPGKDPNASTTQDPNQANTTNATQSSTEDLPPELKDALNFDPAATLDPKTVQESDFYQIKQSVEQNKSALDAGWREQERIESSVKSSDQTVKKRQEDDAKREEEERERQRQQAIQDYEKSKDQRAREQQDADENVRKLPTIQQDEVQWKGLED